MHKFKPALLATAFAAALALPAAHAADNQDFQVLIDIDASCDVVSTDNVDFDTQLAAPGTVDATGGVTVQCTRDQAYNVQLDGGQNSGNDVSDRRMLHANGTDTIAYQLYQDAGRSTPWGETDGTDTVSGTGTGFGSGAPYNQDHTVYARATLAGTELAGAYEDTIKATVTF
ncbi:MAG: spore coat U domain-containing protein [Lysobacter spongiicola]|nr:spore coat U domain-containing protein [Lysobacter spongiicola]